MLIIRINHVGKLKATLLNMPHIYYKIKFVNKITQQVITTMCIMIVTKILHYYTKKNTQFIFSNYTFLIYLLDYILYI